ncbi:adenosine deaminase [Zopfia rhizophila CBS 207.26]|uniref:Adenine deaminase n=1 Tax=Zopfia rhizophila CBS 207.26 TaxID=1314779 RepID=A0A6A6DZ72_9PEZI|nr:adenosine deaminase [Zopfia rhizophila CBS 207.26]
MCQSPLHEFLQRLPKCEHHMHLEGALAPSLLFELAQRNNIALPKDDDAFASPESLIARYKRFTSLDDFLHYYYIGMSVLINTSDFEALAWSYFTHAHRSGVVHAELFFDPQAHTTRGIPYSTVLSGFIAACNRANHELGITTELITCFLRHLPIPDSLALFEDPDVQESYRRGDVRGIGIDSTEVGYQPERFKELYDRAKGMGLRRTAHAGEEGPVGYIANALETLDVERIDHGIQLIDNPELMKKVTAKGTLLTICPLSNVVLKCVAGINDVPIKRFLEGGVRFSINSDDPAYFGGYILENYCKVQEAFGLGLREWEVICRNGIEGSWCEDSRKREMFGILEGLVKEWEGKREEGE